MLDMRLRECARSRKGGGWRGRRGAREVGALLCLPFGYKLALDQEPPHAFSSALLHSNVRSRELSHQLRHRACFQSLSDYQSENV